jgi:hypothetical protein
MLQSTKVWAPGLAAAMAFMAAAVAEGAFITDVQIVEFCDNAGSNCTSLSQESRTAVNGIWGQADIQFNFLAPVQVSGSNLLNSQDFSNVLNALVALTGAEGYVAQFVVGLIADDGSPMRGLGFVGPFPVSGGKGISAIETNIHSADEQGIALAHMFGHNMGLSHLDADSATNLMAPNLLLVSSTEVTLLPDQIAIAQQSSLLRVAQTIPVPAPPTASLLGIAVLTVGAIRRRSRSPDRIQLSPRA